MAHASLEEKIAAIGSPVDMARNSQIGPYVYPKVPAEFPSPNTTAMSGARRPSPIVFPDEK